LHQATRSSRQIQNLPDVGSHGVPQFRRRRLTDLRPPRLVVAPDEMDPNFLDSAAFGITRHCRIFLLQRARDFSHSSRQVADRVREPYHMDAEGQRPVLRAVDPALQPRNETVQTFPLDALLQWTRTAIAQSRTHVDVRARGGTRIADRNKNVAASPCAQYASIKIVESEMILGHGTALEEHVQP